MCIRDRCAVSGCLCPVVRGQDIGLQPQCRFREAPVELPMSRVGRSPPMVQQQWCKHAPRHP
eukprot:6425452-Alexandrium_andersonii.AAC.1